MLYCWKSIKLFFLVVCGFVVWPLLSSQPVLAHPLDEFYQATFITLAPNRVSMIVELYPGVLVAPQITGLVDADGDEVISDAEEQAFVQWFLTDVTFEVDDVPTPLQPTALEFPTVLDLRAGIGIIRFHLSADLPADHRGEHHLFYENNYLSDSGTYLVNALSDKPEWIQINQQNKDVFQKSVRLDYTISPEAPVDFDSEAALSTIDVPGGVTAGQQQLTGFLYNFELTPLLMLMGLSLSVVLGGLHALTPGHGKTLVAAYLIGSRGTVRHAMVLGGIVTFTHTASVIVIGLLALLASQFIVPNLLVPALEVLSGLLVVILGLQLLRARWTEYRQNVGRDHNHDGDHNPDHGHHHHHHHHHHDHLDEHDHAYAHKHGLPHHHHLPDEPVTMGSLLALGISGGLVPCPEALGVMLIAVGLNRILLGLGLVVAFSFGLAAVLIIIGVLLVRAKAIFARIEGAGSRWQTLLPLISAVIVTLLGVGILIKGLLPYLLG